MTQTQPEPAEIRMGGRILCVLSDAPQLGQDLELMIRVHVTEDCIAQHENDAEVRYLKTRLVAAWKPGSPPPIDPELPLWDQAVPEGTIDADDAATV